MAQQRTWTTVGRSGETEQAPSFFDDHFKANVDRPQLSAVHAERETSAYYDHRIDFFRGLSLVFIFVNHIPDNTFTYVTPRTFTLFDSAEVFMFLAGYSAALAYFRLIPAGIHALARKALGRVRVMMTYHLLLLAFVMTVAFLIGRNGTVMTGYEAFIEKIQADPLETAIAAPLLGFQAPLLDILPMYVMVMLMMPFMMWLLAKSPIALLAVSGIVWMFASRFSPAIPTITYGVDWNFNPFCWQLLYAIGLSLGWRTRTGAMPIASRDARRVLDLFCGLFVLFSACVLLTIAFQTINLETANRLRAMYFSLNKQCLDIWRVAGLLATAYFAARLVPRNVKWMTAPVSRWICAAGRASLPIFSLTVVLSFLGKFIIAAHNGDIVADAAVTAGGVIILLAVAVGLRDSALKTGLDRASAFFREGGEGVAQPQPRPAGTQT